jgi:hypothetical protein
MHTTIRQYSGSGALALFDVMEQREPEVRELISTVPGFVSYTAFRADGGGTTVTVCEDKAGTDESTRRAAAWVAENVHVPINAPSISEGDAALRF